MPETHSSPQLILASASPRRAELLRQIGVSFKQAVVSLDESPLADESPEQYVLRLAIAKARAGWQQAQARGEHLPVLGADTTVVSGNRIMGKPADCDEAIVMLEALSGQTHQVLTAVCLARGDQQLSTVVSTDVSFRSLDRAEMVAYWQTGEPADKAGSYAIQGRGAVFVSGISGSYSAVVGLPLMETWQMLADMNS